MKSWEIQRTPPSLNWGWWLVIVWCAARKEEVSAEEGKRRMCTTPPHTEGRLYESPAIGCNYLVRCYLQIFYDMGACFCAIFTPHIHFILTAHYLQSQLLFEAGRRCWSLQGPARGLAVIKFKYTNSAKVAVYAWCEKNWVRVLQCHVEGALVPRAGITNNAVTILDIFWLHMLQTRIQAIPFCFIYNDAAWIWLTASVSRRPGKKNLVFLCF